MTNIYVQSISYLAYLANKRGKRNRRSCVQSISYLAYLANIRNALINKIDCSVNIIFSIPSKQYDRQSGTYLCSVNIIFSIPSKHASFAFS